MRYWRGRGGTPMGIPAELAPIPVGPGMRLWLRLDEELIGGLDESGCYARPEALAEVVDEYEEAVEVWLDTFAGIPPPLGPTGRAIARRMLRELGAGRAEARAEELLPTEEAGERKQRGSGRRWKPNTD